MDGQDDLEDINLPPPERQPAGNNPMSSCPAKKPIFKTPSGNPARSGASASLRA